MVTLAQQRQQVRAPVQAVIDSTGLDARQASLYYINQRPSRSKRCKKWPKLSLFCDRRTHLVLAADARLGPRNDCPLLKPLARRASALVPVAQLLADAGYDSEENHRLCREELGIAESIIAVNLRGRRRPPQDGYRAQMHQAFPKEIYRQRAQAESINSRIKRLLGASLRSRTATRQNQEAILRVITFDLMLL